VFDYFFLQSMSREHWAASCLTNSKREQALLPLRLSHRTMSSVTIYFGTQPSRGQIVADSVRAKGLELLKIKPEKVHYHGHPTTVQPGYAVYKSHLPMFMRQACGEDIVDFRNPFGSIDVNAFSPLSIPLPALVISWSFPIADEVREQLASIGYRDTVVKGRPAMIVEKPTKEHVIAALERKALETSPTSENTVNIFALRRCSYVLGLISTFLRIHQYPAFIDKEHETEFNKAFAVFFAEGTYEDDESGRVVLIQVLDNKRTDSAPEDEAVMDTDAVAPKDLKRRFKVSLATPPKDFVIENVDDRVTITEGLVFPYLSDLAKFDRSTVLSVVKRFFYAGLGDTAEECDEMYRDLTVAWGNVVNTRFGNIMAHLCKVIEISLDMQCAPRVMMNGGVYNGVFMSGSAFSLTVLEKTYMPAEIEDVRAALRQMDRHMNALWSIMEDVAFVSNEDREAQYHRMKNIWQLKACLEALPLKGGVGVRDRVLMNAKDLSFPENHYLDPTAANIDFVLSIISDPLKDLASLPALHPSLLFHTDRLSLAMGAFGEVAPSFRVPGGKEMELSKAFKVTSAAIRKEKGPQGHKEISKIAATLLPLDMAIQHLKMVVQNKTVLNPFGNAVANASSSHINKVFEGDSCVLLVSALRKLAKVTVAVEGKGGTKRGAEEEDSAASQRKKAKFGF
jgi:hypothetical protein